MGLARSENYNKNFQMIWDKFLVSQTLKQSQNHSEYIAASIVKKLFRPLQSSINMGLARPEKTNYNKKLFA